MPGVVVKVFLPDHYLFQKLMFIPLHSIIIWLAGGFYTQIRRFSNFSKTIANIARCMSASSKI